MERGRKHIIKNNDLSKRLDTFTIKNHDVLSSKNSPPKNLLNLFLKYKYDLIPVVDKKEKFNRYYNKRGAFISKS